MGTDDRIDATATDIGGKAKEGFGKLTGDEKLENEGKLDQAKSAAKHAAEDVKDAAERVVDGIKELGKK